MNSYTIVSAWFDIREQEENPLKNIEGNGEFCTLNHYLNSSRLILEKDFPIVFFTEPRFEYKIWELRPKELHYKTRVITKKFEDLNMYCLYEKYKEAHDLNPIHNLHKEKFTSLYKFIINQKTEFVKEVIMMNPFDSDRFAWMDLRLHDVYNMSTKETNDVFNGFFNHFEDNRVIITQSSYTNNDSIINRQSFYSYTQGKVCAGFFGGKREPILKFCNLCRKEFLHSLDQSLTPTDEMIYSVVITENRDLIEPHIGDYGDVLRNLSFYRNNYDWVLSFLKISFDESNHYWTHKICEKLRLGYKNKSIILKTDEIYTIWYYNYVANYWMNKHDYCKIILEEFFLLLPNNPDLSMYLKDVYNFFKQNISYLNDIALIEKYEHYINSI